MNNHIHRVIWLCLLLFTLSMAKAATFTVVSTNNTGAGTLRKAISNANANGPGLDNIYFNIPGAGIVHTITLSSQLPIITTSINIDATSQPGFAGQPLIEINGNGAATDGLSYNGSGNNAIKGIVINRCSSNGIYILGGSGNNVIQTCYIGTDATGKVKQPNLANGISIVNNGNNQIGGSSPFDGNIVSGNLGNGISLLGSTCSNNTVEGNYLGTSPTGEALGNTLNGLRIINGSSNAIGGTTSAHSNVIAYNEGNGILIYETSGSAIDNTVIFNSIYRNSNLGIDLGNDAITANDLNDPDTGANTLQNWPVIDLITDDGIDTQISGSLNSTTSHDFRIDIYRNGISYFNASHGEGYEHLTNTTITTDGTGNAVFLITLTGVVLDKLDRISATATRTVSGSPKGTSEFGLNWVFEQSYCNDGIDNDGDGLIDCADSDCSQFDSDGDGQCSQSDLDEDNDGLRDIVECPDMAKVGLKDGDFENQDILSSGLDGGATDLNTNSRVWKGDASNIIDWESSDATKNHIEIWQNGNSMVNDVSGTAFSGSQWIEVNATTIDGLFQEIATTPGDLFHWSFAHRKRTGFIGSASEDTLELLIGPDAGPLTSQGTYASAGDASWAYHSGTYTIPAGQTNTILRFKGVSSASGVDYIGNFIDNVEFHVIPDCPDSDLDGVEDLFDLDSDNDGIYDVIEAGGTDADADGVIGAGPITDSDTDGWSSIVDPDESGTILSDPDTDSDGLENRVDSDSDGDSCNDVIEAGFPDSDGDGQLGGLAPPTVNASGTVTSGGL